MRESSDKVQVRRWRRGSRKEMAGETASRERDARKRTEQLPPSPLMGPRGEVANERSDFVFKRVLASRSRPMCAFVGAYGRGGLPEAASNWRPSFWFSLRRSLDGSFADKGTSVPRESFNDLPKVTLFKIR